MTEFKIEPYINHYSPVFYVSDPKSILEYYAKLYFFSEHKSGWVEYYGINMVFKKSNSDVATKPYPVGYKGYADIYCIVNGIDELYEEFKTAGAVFYFELRTNFNNRKEFTLKDPDGYSIRFLETAGSLKKKIRVVSRVLMASDVKGTLEYFCLGW